MYIYHLTLGGFALIFPLDGTRRHATDYRISDANSDGTKINLKAISYMYPFFKSNFRRHPALLHGNIYILAGKINHQLHLADEPYDINAIKAESDHRYFLILLRQTWGRDHENQRRHFLLSYYDETNEALPDKIEATSSSSCAFGEAQIHQLSLSPLKRRGNSLSSGTSAKEKQLAMDISDASVLNKLQILPERYSYYGRLDQDPNHAIECVICMTTINSSQRSNNCMVTPCYHFFHAACLQRWMDIKRECSTCRRPLPPA